MFLTALLAATLAAPVPKAKPAVLYIPTAEGDKRVVLMTAAGGRAEEVTHTVTKSAVRDGTHTLTVRYECDGRAFDYQFEVSAKGVFHLSNPAGERPAQPWLRLPAGAGDTWAGDDGTAYTVGKEEVVEVAAGKFKAIPVTSERVHDGRVSRGTSWYAAGVGVVKNVEEIDGKALWSQELKEFTPGQKDKK